MSALSVVPDLLPTSAAIHHPSCPTRLGELPCICPTSTTPLEQERCPSCTGELQVWKVVADQAWAEWLACLRCTWREQL